MVDALEAGRLVRLAAARRSLHFGRDDKWVRMTKRVATRSGIATIYERKKRAAWWPPVSVSVRRRLAGRDQAR